MRVGRVVNVNIRNEIYRHIQHNNGLLPSEIAVRCGLPVAVVRSELIGLLFDDLKITCTRQGKYVTGDPTPLIELPN